MNLPGDFAAGQRFDEGTDLEFQVDIPPEMMQGMTGGGAIAPRISRNEALQVPAVMRSRNLIAGTLARLPIHIRDKEHHLVSPTTLLDQINPDIPNVVTLALTYEDLLFEGISWWRILETGWHGYPTFAEHLDHQRVFVSGFISPVEGQAGFQPASSMRVFIDGLPVPDDSVIRFDSPNPPLLVHAARAIRTCLVLDKTATRYADEPMPLGYFTPREGTRRDATPDEVSGLLDTWAVARATRVWGYVGAAWEAKTLAFNAEQIQLAEQRQHAVLEIARAAGVDPEDLGVSTTSRTYQNSEQRRQDLLDFTFAPYMAAVEQRLSMRDILPRGYEAKVNLDAFLRADTLTRMQAYEIGERVGAYTVPEVRDLEDRPPIRQTTAVPTPPAQQPTPNGQSVLPGRMS